MKKIRALNLTNSYISQIKIKSNIVRGGEQKNVNGNERKDISEVVFVEVKSGNARTSPVEKTLKDVIQNKKISWAEYRIPKDLTKKDGVEFDKEGLINNKEKSTKEGKHGV